MQLNKVFTTLLCGLVIFTTACKQEEVSKDILAPTQTPLKEEVIVVPINPKTGEPEAPNYKPTNIQDGNLVKSTARVGGQIIDDTEYRVGREPNNGLEVDGSLPAGYVLTGIGARAVGNKITTLVLEGRLVNADGSLGNRATYRFGSDKDHSLEVWYAVPDGYVITGVGARLDKGNVTTMRVTYRELGSDLRLSTANPYKAYVGTEPRHSLEAEFLPSDYQPGLDLSRTVLTRVGMREYASNLTTLHVWASTLK